MSLMSSLVQRWRISAKKVSNSETWFLGLPWNRFRKSLMLKRRQLVRISLLWDFLVRERSPLFYCIEICQMSRSPKRSLNCIMILRRWRIRRTMLMSKRRMILKRLIVSLNRVEFRDQFINELRFMTQVKRILWLLRESKRFALKNQIRLKLRLIWIWLRALRKLIVSFRIRV